MAPSHSNTLQDRLEALRKNRTSGAIDLALEAIDIAQAWIESGESASQLAEELQQMHPGIATVANVGRLLTEPSEDLPARLRQVRESVAGGNRLIAEKLRPLIAATATVVTLSNSSTVRDALIALRVRSVYVLESHPGGEGRQMAETLRRAYGDGGSDAVRLIPDAAMGNVIPDVDCAVVGIDSFDTAGAILHKVGTLPLALCCQHFGRPFYAAGHSLKRIRGALTGLPEAGKNPQEQIFDCTPAELITQLITEKG